MRKLTGETLFSPMSPAQTPSLYPYQVEGIRQIIHDFGHVLLADPPGAGKTCQAINAALLLGAAWVLVVCPASLRLNWAREFDKWSGGYFRPHPVLKGTDQVVPTHAKPRAVIVSYDLASKENVLRELVQHTWDVLILDEAHFCRARRAKRTTACLKHLLPKAKKCIAITGTPLPNGRASEAFALFSALDPEKFGNWFHFHQRYCVKEVMSIGSRQVVKYTKSKNLKELGRIARERFMIRRPKEVVLESLPPLVRQTVPLVVEDVPPIPKEFSDEVESLVEAGVGTVPSHIATARRELGLSKVGPAAEFIGELLQDTPHLVVFAHHVDVVEMLGFCLHQKGISFVSFRGWMSAEARQAAVDIFQRGDVQVFLGSLLASNTGITLTKASAVVMVEQSFVPEENAQAEARVYRLTQTDITRVYYLTIPDSLDDAVTTAVLRKQKDIGRVMGDGAQQKMENVHV